jgi:hypothetical protein
VIVGSEPCGDYPDAYTSEHVLMHVTLDPRSRKCVIDRPQIRDVFLRCHSDGRQRIGGHLRRRHGRTGRNIASPSPTTLTISVLRAGRLIPAPTSDARQARSIARSKGTRRVPHPYHTRTERSLNDVHSKIRSRRAVTRRGELPSGQRRQPVRPADTRQRRS